MIVRVNRDLYRYEIHSLVKAFCPQENVKVIVEGDPHAQKALREDPHIFMDIRFDEELLTVVIHGARDRGLQERAKGTGTSADPDSAAAKAEPDIVAAGIEPESEIAGAGSDIVMEDAGPDITTENRKADHEAADAASAPTAACATPASIAASATPASITACAASASLAACAAEDLEEADAAADYVRSASVQGGTVKSRDLKDAMKSLLYDTLSSYTGLELPWGDLIGIRPTKIAMAQLETGASGDEVRQTLMREHRVSPEKASLAVNIARRERKILSGIHYENGYSLYIGIPFCPTTCLYCSFTSYPIARWRDHVDAYLDALIRELEETARIMKGQTLDTVYIGGGTPTAIEADQLDRLCGAVERYYDMSTVQEFTVEAGRPDSITEEKLRVLRAHPVTRISVNPQTMNEATLHVIGRGHTVEQVRETYAMARRCGFDNINMDIILGLPGEDAEHVRRTVQGIEEMDPDSLTVHSLAIKRASRLRRMIDENGYPVFINTEETMRIAADGAQRMRMQPYYLYRQKNMSGNFENVGYARDGQYGIYNILIMEEKQTILAVGAGSITKRVFHRPDGSLRIERCEDAKDIATYLDCHGEMLERKRQLFAEPGI